MTSGDVEYEALIFGKYLLKKTPNTKAIKLYVDAIENINDVTMHSVKSIQFVCEHPKLLRLVDSGLAIIEPESELRRRLYMMFSILESSSEYHTYFLPRKRSSFYVLVIGITGISAVVRAVVGVIIVRVAIK